MVMMKKMEKPKFEDSEDLEKERQRFISKAEKKKDKMEWVRILLRIRGDFIEYIDESIEGELNATRTSWILKTIQDRIKKEQNKK